MGGGGGGGHNFTGNFDVGVPASISELPYSYT